MERTFGIGSRVDSTQLQFLRHALHNLFVHWIDSGHLQEAKHAANN